MYETKDGRVTTKNDWQDGYSFGTIKPRPVAKDHVLRIWLEKHLDRVQGGRCIEIGCCPGSYLTIFGDLGYELNGIDYLDSVKGVAAFLNAEGYQTGSFYHQDFFSSPIEEKYDLVYSLGFIEHFTNIELTIQRHVDLVADRGFLVLEAPNFIGIFQNLIHRFLDTENYRKHHLGAMEVQRWETFLRESGFDIIYSGYFGGFDFWLEPEKRNYVERKMVQFLKFLKPYLARVLRKDHKTYSPFCGVVAQKSN